MRRILIAALTFGSVSAVQAADMPDLPILRGAYTEGLTTTRVVWQGYYIGGQWGYGSSDENFKGSTRTMAAALLADTLVESAMGVSQWNLALGKVSARTSGFGGFAGYNWQWEDVIFGVEASYLHGGFGGSSSATEARSSGGPLQPGNFIHDVTATSQAAISIKDMATLRVRAGYTYECFLPYLFGGVALGNADITRSITITDFLTPGPGNLQPGGPVTPLRAVEAQHNHLIYGYSTGLGVDINLIGGLFVRAEWEYIRFTAAVDTNINTVRAGLGYKF